MAATSITTTSGYTVKVVFTDMSTGSLRFWNNSGSAFEAYNASNITAYGVAATETGTTGKYTFTYPSLPVGKDYEWTAYRQAGGSFATGDLAAPLMGDKFEWGGFDVLTSYAINTQYASEGKIPGDVEAWFGSSNANVQNMPANVAALGGGGSGSAYFVLTSFDGQSPLNAGVEPRPIYRGRVATFAYTSEADYDGDVQAGDTLYLRIMPLDSYEDQTASTYPATVQTTATASIVDTRLTATFTLSAAQTANLPAGALGDGSTNYRLQVLHSTEGYPLLDRLVSVRRAMAAPA